MCSSRGTFFSGNVWLSDMSKKYIDCVVVNVFAGQYLHYIKLGDWYQQIIWLKHCHNLHKIKRQHYSVVICDLCDLYLLLKMMNFSFRICCFRKRGALKDEYRGKSSREGFYCKHAKAQQAVSTLKPLLRSLNSFPLKG